MPFGLKNAGATYQRLVNKMFKQQIGRNMEVYVDDMLVKSKESKSHLDDLAEAFGVLRAYQMKLNPEKCVFGVTSGKFLGFVVHHRGIEANPEKIRAVLDLLPPTNIKQLQSLNGKIASLNRFVSRAADRCLPFFETLRKGIKFQWTEECEAAFQELKKYLTTAPILAKPEAGEDLYLYVAASATAVSSVLVKEETGQQRPIYYVSKAMVDAETRYPSLEKLALAVVVTARRLRPYFQAHKIVILTNYPLRQVFHKAEASGRLMKWAIELSEYEISFSPRSAIKGQVMADFIAELTGATSDPTLADTIFWTLHVDGASNDKGSGAGIILISPEGNRFESSIRFSFPASNNEAEYEALLAGLRLAHGIGVTHLQVRSDSLLVVNQVANEYQARDERMAKYVGLVKNLVTRFQKYQMEQVPRSKNSNADALARLAAAHETSLPRTVIVEVQEHSSIECLEVNLNTSEPNETWMTPIRRYLDDSELPSDREQARSLIRKAASYLVIQGQLYKRGFSLPLLRCLDPTEADLVTKEIHGGICGSHSGPRALAKRVIRQGYYWPTLHRDTKEFAQSCDRCQRFSPVPHQPAEPLTNLLSPWPFAQWGIDLIGPLPQAPRQLKFAVVAVDYFTKWAEAEPLAKITAHKIKDFVWKSIVCRFGVPMVIISDNGKQFENHMFSSFCSELGIAHHKSSPAHPQSNGQVEAVNKILKTLLKCKTTGRFGTWAEELPKVLWAYRTTSKTATGETPFSLAFGAEAVLPIELTIPTARVKHFEENQNSEELRANLDALEEFRELARLKTIEQKQRVKRYYDSRLRPRRFSEGNLVLRRTMPNKRELGAGVLQPTWEGPYRVKSIARPGAYYLETLAGESIPHPWNAEHLRIYYA